MREKRKIGIVSLYYRNYNYGGLLQAYALQKVITKQGIETEQVCIENISNTQKKIRLSRRIRRIAGLVLRPAKLKLWYRQNSKNVALKKFMLDIPHSNEVYRSRNEGNLSDKYRSFIVGSDQVWNPEFWCSSYLLEFENDGKKKNSYSASLGINKLKEQDKEVMKLALSSFANISVRESQGKELLEDLLNRRINTTLDPTLLLDKKDWTKLVRNSKGVNIREPYAFVYLLGENHEHRKIILECIRKLNLKIAIIPMYFDEDYYFGDYNFYKAGPNEFVDLISRAEYIFTDSFHAVVFSIIFHKNFWIMKRNSDADTASMNNRLYSLMEMLQIEKRFLDEEHFDKDALQQEIDFSNATKRLLEMRASSMDYLCQIIMNK